MREAKKNRKTTETDVDVCLRVDGAGLSDIATGCGFLNHMLELFSRHGCFDVAVRCTGDFGVDYHHTVEDIGLVLGRAFCEALGDRRGIRRYGSALLPMDEALIRVALDISGRGGYYGDLGIPGYKIGDFDVELVDEFFSAFCRESGVTLHIKKLSGTNAHHIAEASFKGFARALRDAVALDAAAPDAIPSTKGTIL
ncbi:MAG: imidazoleglycerol-phosphate dehydratase HisB, partial [Oscillospiraceae bacterium]|nr:imidazoleglycerol-phosphate dehydratase HisB [Oscillospiraceae bacterium]